MNKAQEDAQTCTSFVKVVMKHVYTIVVQSLLIRLKKMLKRVLRL